MNYTPTFQRLSLLGLFFSIFLFVFPAQTHANTGDIIIIENDISENILQNDAQGNTKLYFGEDLAHFIEWNADSDAFIFSDNIDFGGNEIINFRMENLASPPLCDAENSGRMYHNTSDTYSYICDDSVWKILDNDEDSAQPMLPYLYNVYPNFLPYNTTADIRITGTGLNSLTTFALSNGVTLNSFEILNNEEAILNVTSGNSDAISTITGVNDGETWQGNSLSLQVASSLSLSDILNNFTLNASELTDWIPDLYPLTLDYGATATFIFDGGDNIYDQGNYIGTDTKNPIAYTDSQIITDETAFGTNGKYFTFLQNNIFILSATVGDGFKNFFISGNLGADGNGVVDELVIEYSGYTAYVKRVYGAGSVPSLNHIFILDSNAITADTSHIISTNTNSDYQELTNIETLATLENNNFYYLAFALNNGKYMSNDDIRGVIEFFIDKMLSNIS